MAVFMYYICFFLIIGVLAACAADFLNMFIW